MNREVLYPAVTITTHLEVSLCEELAQHGVMGELRGREHRVGRGEGKGGEGGQGLG